MGRTAQTVFSITAHALTVSNFRRSESVLDLSTLRVSWQEVKADLLLVSIAICRP